jgi:hypothetical protein
MAASVVVGAVTSGYATREIVSSRALSYLLQITLLFIGYGENI